MQFSTFDQIPTTFSIAEKKTMENFSNKCEKKKIGHAIRWCCNVPVKSAPHIDVPAPSHYGESLSRLWLVVGRVRTHSRTQYIHACLCVLVCV